MSLETNVRTGTNAIGRVYFYETIQAVSVFVKLFRLCLFSLTS